jgi:hypothetical protein
MKTTYELDGGMLVNFKAPSDTDKTIVMSISRKTPVGVDDDGEETIAIQPIVDIYMSFDEVKTLFQGVMSTVYQCEEAIQAQSMGNYQQNISLRSGLR